MVDNLAIIFDSDDDFYGFPLLLTVFDTIYCFHDCYDYSAFHCLYACCRGYGLLLLLPFPCAFDGRSDCCPFLALLRFFTVFTIFTIFTILRIFTFITIFTFLRLLRFFTPAGNFPRLLGFFTLAGFLTLVDTFHICDGL